jgi:YD repeat-containing protein
VGNRLEEIDPRGDWTKIIYAYDKINRLRRMEMPTGSAESAGSRAVIEFEYDQNDNLIKQTDPRGKEIVTQHFYDKLNRREKTIDAEGGISLFVYDSVGNLVRVLDPRAKGNAASSRFVTQFIYDKNNRVKEIIDAEGGHTKIFYDANGNTDYQFDPKTGKTDFEYDELDREILRIDAEGGRWTTTYDDGSNFATEKDALGFTTTYTYDFLNQLRTRTLDIGKTPGERRVTDSFRYDVVGNLVEETDARGGAYKTVYKYDNLNRLRRVEKALVSLDGPSATLVTEYEYDKAGNRTVEKDPRGVVRTDKHDARNRVISTTREVGELGKGVMAEWKFVYDLAGNLIEKHDPRGDYFTTRYTYDNLNRLKKIISPQGAPEFPKSPATEENFYDGVGNLI